MKRKDFVFGLVAAPLAFVAGVRSFRGVPPVVGPRRHKYVGRTVTMDFVDEKVPQIIPDRIVLAPGIQSMDTMREFARWRAYEDAK